MKVIPNAPLFRDPIYDGAADPVIIWNPFEKTWWLFYTCRRASSPGLGVSYMHGTDIGIASSEDGGATWVYRGTAKGLEYEKGRNTYWAPEIIEHENIFHMYVSYVRGIPMSWEYPRTILHYTSTDLWNWKLEGPIKLASDRVIDACVIQLPDKSWKMWYKNERDNSYTYSAFSKDLYNWSPGRAEITDCPHEGPNVFWFKGYYWMLTDPWHGLGVYKSDDGESWVRCPDILDRPGIRLDDGAIGAHADVLVNKEHAYVFYFTHPEVNVKERNDPKFVWEYRHRRSSIQVAELIYQDGILQCDRDQVTLDL